MRSIMKLRKHCVPITKLSVALGYSGAKRKLALDAIESLKVEPLNIHKDSEVRMFLKDDKYHDNDVKAPRCIQYRDKRYAITLAQYCYPIEHAIYKHREDGNLCFAKGRNLKERALDIRQMWDSFTNPVAWLLDHSKFDAHVNEHLHRAARKLNGACYELDGTQRFVKELLRAQLKNKGRTKNGTKYQTRATRMSGDQNTGLDNSTLNWAMIDHVLESCGVKGYKYVDGDDSVVIMDASDRKKCDAKLFKHFGMVTKSEFVTEFEHVEFCQTKPVWNGIEWIMVRNPDRVLDRIGWIVKKHPVCRDAVYVKSVMLCESALNEGLPVMGPLSSRIANETNIGKKKLMSLETDYHVKQLNKIKGLNYFRDVSYESRLSYENAWGVSVATQRKYESMTMTYPSDPLPDLLDMIPSALVL